jgi:adenylosuccinate lyase
MIGRYTSREMQNVWSDENKYATWAAIEVEVMKSQGRSQFGIEVELWRALEMALVPSPDQVARHEERLKHDVMAFLEAWRCNTDNREIHRWLHYGLTSSDVVETGQAVLLSEANWLIANAGYQLLEAFVDHALKYKDTKRVGRTHGQFAEPTTWGYRVADFALAISRGLDRFAAACNDVQVAHISGPLGNYAHVPRSVELDVAKRFRLNAPDSATQVLMRDSLGAWAYSLASLVSICEAFALEVRHGQRSEVKELFEGRSAHQEGSSSMPHKQNPITSEKICGLAKMARAYVMPITEGVALWHERDISHSSVERIAVPDLCAITEHVLTETFKLVRDLRVNEAGMRYNTSEGSTFMLNQYIKNGMTRNEAYKAAKTGARVGNCPPADVQHTWDALSIIKTALNEARLMNGVSLA